MINLELSKKHEETFGQVMMLAEHMMRPYSRKYDKEEHTVPVEMEEVAKLIGGARSNPGGTREPVPEGTVVNGGNMGAVVGLFGLCWGDVGLFLGMPGSGLGNAAITAVGTPEQVEKFGGSYAAMCITEPGTGSDSASVSTTAVADGDEWILNGEKIYVTDGERSDTLVVWATLDKSLGKAAIKSFIVEKGTPGCEVVRLEHKLGIRASDTASISFNDCRIPRDNILGSPEIATDAEGRKKAFGGVMPTAYGLGGYDAVMSPMSLALGWGLAFSSIVTLFLVPSLYVAANDISRKIDEWRGQQQAVQLDIANEEAA